jgi:hypothetical protein
MSQGWPGTNFDLMMTGPPGIRPDGGPELSGLLSHTQASIEGSILKTSWIASE